MFVVQEILKDKGLVCKSILDSLPEWFALDEAKNLYVKGVEETDFFVGFEKETSAIAGFLSLKEQTETASEIYVMGVYPRFHHKGVGKVLVQEAEKHARLAGKKFLSVKTLAPEHPDPNYAATRKFYLSQGFLPFEVFPTLWGKDNPCLLMIKALDEA